MTCWELTVAQWLSRDQVTRICLYSRSAKHTFSFRHRPKFAFHSFTLSLARSMRGGKLERTSGANVICSINFARRGFEHAQIEHKKQGLNHVLIFQIDHGPELRYGPACQRADLKANSSSKIGARKHEIEWPSLTSYCHQSLSNERERVEVKTFPYRIHPLF